MLTASIANASLARHPAIEGEPTKFKARFEGGEFSFVVPLADEQAWLAAVGCGANVRVVVAIGSPAKTVKK